MIDLGSCLHKGKTPSLYISFKYIPLQGPSASGKRYLFSSSKSVREPNKQQITQGKHRVTIKSIFRVSSFRLKAARFSANAFGRQG